MIVLLPPSESKWNRPSGPAADPGTWSFPELAHARAELAAVLASVSRAPGAAAVLRVPARRLDDIAWNLVLGSAPATPAAQVYTGVLYEALGLATLEPSARRRAMRRLVVVSALRGAVRPGDRITAYRLSAGTDLPGAGRPEAFWGRRLGPVLTAAAGKGVVVDCRSGAYLPMWRPGAELAPRWVLVKVPGASHLAKRTRGRVARALCEQARAPRSVTAVAEVLAERFEVTLSPARRPGQPWILDVSGR